VGRDWLSPSRIPSPALGPSGLASPTPTTKVVPTPLNHNKRHGYVHIRSVLSALVSYRSKRLRSSDERNPGTTINDKGGGINKAVQSTTPVVIGHNGMLFLQSFLVSLYSMDRYVPYSYRQATRYAYHGSNEERRNTTRRAVASLLRPERILCLIDLLVLLYCVREKVK